MKISVIGLGKLGYCVASVFSEYFMTIGIDRDESVVEKINAGKHPIYEKSLQVSSHPRFRATTDIKAVKDADIIFLMLPTPVKPMGEHSTDTIVGVLSSISGYLHDRDCTVVLMSTVSIGACRLLRDYLPKTCKFVYMPEFMALGRVVQDFRRPSIFVYGLDAIRTATTALDAVMETVHYKSLPPLKKSYETAELLKLAFNAYMCLRIDFSNGLAAMCGLIKQGDVDFITETLSKDRRIAGHLPKGGLTYGGPCLPYDRLAFNYDYIKFTRGDKSIEHLIAQHINNTLQGARNSVGFLGISYKPGVPSCEKSPVLAIAAELREDIKLYGFDYYVKDLMVPMTMLGSVDEVVEKSDAVVLGVNDPAYVPSEVKGKMIIDCWRIWPGDTTGFDYFAVGSEWNWQY